jgi:hypothetical protein
VEKGREKMKPIALVTTLLFCLSALLFSDSTSGTVTAQDSFRSPFNLQPAPKWVWYSPDFNLDELETDNLEHRLGNLKKWDSADAACGEEDFGYEVKAGDRT